MYVFIRSFFGLFFINSFLTAIPALSADSKIDMEKYGNIIRREIKCYSTAVESNVADISISTQYEHRNDGNNDYYHVIQSGTFHPSEKYFLSSFRVGAKPCNSSDTVFMIKSFPVTEIGVTEYSKTFGWQLNLGFGASITPTGQIGLQISNSYGSKRSVRDVTLENHCCSENVEWKYVVENYGSPIAQQGVSATFDIEWIWSFKDNSNSNQPRKIDFIPYISDVILAKKPKRKYILFGEIKGEGESISIQGSHV